MSDCVTDLWYGVNELEFVFAFFLVEVPAGVGDVVDCSKVCFDSFFMTRL